MDGFYCSDGVIYCRALSDMDGIGHGFSTRKGGVSALPYTSALNLAYCRGDDDLTVNENRRIFAAKAGADVNAMITAEQTHGTNVAYADGTVKHFYDTDGFVTDVPGVFITVKVADCQPILFADPVARVVGCCHAGWRGTVSGIAASVVSRLEELGADRRNTVAALGPCIGSCCFEVKDDFVLSVERINRELLSFVTEDDGVKHADIRQMNRHILLQAGLREQNVYVNSECTCCDPHSFYSHRRDKSLRGSMMAGIIIK